MGKKSFQKVKLLKIWEILCKDSDEEQPIDTVGIIEKLNQVGINCDRKTLYSDIDELNRHGYTVCKKRSRRNQYYVKHSRFSVAELRILIDAVQSANFISQQKTDELVEKIANLGGSYKADILKNGMYFDMQKYNNEAIYNNVATLDEATNQNRKVSFKYFHYDENGNTVFSKDGTRYKVNPLALVFNDNCYYLVCYNDKYQNLSNYRIDRMDNVRIEDESIVMAECAKGFDIAEHRRKEFSMFTGEEMEVEIEFDKSLIDVMMDRFGTAVKMRSVDENNCRLTANVQVSPVFFGWCVNFGDKLKIVRPNRLAIDYIAELSKIVKLYQNESQRNKDNG